MTKIKSILLLALCAIALTGCDGPKTQEQRDAEMASHITEFNYKGHRYIRYISDGMNRAGGGIAHDPDCLCHQKGGDSND